MTILDSNGVAHKHRAPPTGRANTSAAAGSSLHGSRRYWAAASAAALMLVAPAVAAAQSCYELDGERIRINNAALQLLADHPGVHATAAFCKAQADSTQEQTGDSDQANSTLFGCITVGCLLIGVDNCYDTISRWYDLIQQEKRVELYMRRQECGQ